MRAFLFSFFLMLISSSVFLIMPGNASDYSLAIFGNANMDDTIDERDIEYVDGVINGTNAATNLSDANYDGRVDEEDIDQIKLIIQGEDKETTIIDSMDRIVTVKKPVERIVTTHSHHIEAMRAIQLEMNKIGNYSVPSSKPYFSSETS